jgi:hypothetical protein
MTTLTLSRPSLQATPLGLLGVLSLGAAAIHFAVMPEHFAEWWAFGVFFGALGWFQAAWPLWLTTEPPRPAIFAGILVNAATVGLWVVSRTTGLPIGPEPWTPEAVGVADVVATALELVLVVGLVATFNRARPSSVSGLTQGSINGVTVVVAVLVAVGTTIAIALAAFADSMPGA